MLQKWSATLSNYVRLSPRGKGNMKYIIYNRLGLWEKSYDVGITYIHCKRSITDRECPLKVKSIRGTEWKWNAKKPLRCCATTRSPKGLLAHAATPPITIQNPVSLGLEISNVASIRKKFLSALAELYNNIHCNNGIYRNYANVMYRVYASSVRPWALGKAVVNFGDLGVIIKWLRLLVKAACQCSRLLTLSNRCVLFRLSGRALPEARLKTALIKSSSQVRAHATGGELLWWQQMLLTLLVPNPVAL